VSDEYKEKTRDIYYRKVSLRRHSFSGINLPVPGIGNEYEYWGKSFDDKFKTLCASRSSFPTPEHPTG
jgi:hypothetical protein